MKPCLREGVAVNENRTTGGHFLVENQGPGNLPACSTLRVVHWIEKARTRAGGGGGGTFRVPFTFVSSPLFDSLEQAKNLLFMSMATDTADTKEMVN